MSRNSLFSKLGFKKKNKNKSDSKKGELKAYISKQILKLTEKQAADIMTPRVDVVGFKIGESLDEILQMIRKNGFSRYPVWLNKVDDIVGILYVKDLLYYISNIYPTPLKEVFLDESVLRKPFFVPESKQIEGLLSSFQTQKIHIAVILDEYGGFSGLVTLEDIIEIIMGDIQDEHDHEEEEIHKISDNVYIVDGRTPLEDLSEELGLNFSKYNDDIDSIGGLIYSSFDRIPLSGERIELDGITYQVQKQIKNKIISVKIFLPVKEKE